jgi:type III secretory pathway lipoprotein EscJ
VQLDGFEGQIEASLAVLSSVKVVDVVVKGSMRPSGKLYTEAVVLAMSSPEPLSNAQIINIAQLITTSVDGLADRHVNLMDDTDNGLNLELRPADERKKFWTGIAINVAKILAVLAALIALRLFIEAIGKGIEGVEQDR